MSLRAFRSTALVLLAAAPLALAACGDDDDGNEAGSDETTVASPEVSGELTATGIGEIEQGSTTDEANEAFGSPDKQQEGPGCELAPGSDRALAWTYALKDGEVILVFNAETAELNNYRVTTPGLETAEGDRVGEPFAELQANQGDDLKGLPLGAKPTSKAGLWQVVEGPESQLLFDIRGGKVSAISGGNIQICE